MKSASVALFLVIANLVAVFACTIEQEMAMLQALKQMKECKKSALYNSLKPLMDCKAVLPSLQLPKLNMKVGKWDKPCGKWGKWGGKWGGEGCEAAGRPLVFLLPAPQLLPQLQSLAPTCPSVAAPPPPPVQLAPPPPSAAFQTVPSAFPPPPPPAYSAPYQYAPPQATVYRRLVTELPLATPVPSAAAPAAPATAPPTCAAPQKQLFYVPQAQSGAAASAPQSPLLFLSNNKCACTQ